MKTIIAICFLLAGAVAVVTTQPAAEPTTAPTSAPTTQHAECLICVGHEIEVTDSTPRSEFEGKTYYFCSESCKKWFDINQRNTPNPKSLAQTRAWQAQIGLMENGYDFDYTMHSCPTSPM